jgi:tRNA-dihydrouridine synthase A
MSEPMNEPMSEPMNEPMNESMIERGGHDPTALRHQPHGEHLSEQRRGQTRALSVAPMMDRTDRHFRWMMRLLTRQTLLYTEMVTMNAVLHGDRQSLLGYGEAERPLALQLGGDDPTLLAECARIAEGMGYDEVNLNVGCPSERVQKGSFGACLMAHPEVVARCVEAMRRACALPITVKHRIGVDDRDSYDDMLRFVQVVAQAGCDRFSVHARKAWLKGLSPKQNREVPPLRYADVYRLKQERPDSIIEINGGITTLAQAREHLDHVDAVMIGRAAYDNPYIFAAADREVFGVEGQPPTRAEVVEQMIDYAGAWVAQGGRLGHIGRHMLMLYAHQPGAGLWRRHLSEHMHREGAGAEVLREALARVQGG